MNICSAASGHHANIQVWRRGGLNVFHIVYILLTYRVWCLFVCCRRKKELGYVALCSAHSFNTKRQSGPLKGRSLLVKTQKRSHSDVTQQCSRALLHFLLNLWEMLFELEKSGDAAFDFMESLAAGVTRLEDSDRFFFLYTTTHWTVLLTFTVFLTLLAERELFYLLTITLREEKLWAGEGGRNRCLQRHKRQSSKYFWALTSYGPRTPPPSLIYSGAVVWTSRGTSTFLEACLDGDEEYNSRIERPLALSDPE